MDEMEKLKQEYEKLAKRLENIEEVGSLELKRVDEELRNLDTRISLAYTAITSNPEIDLYEKVDAGNLWVQLKEDIRIKMLESSTARRARKELLDTKFAQYRNLKQLKRENQKRINEFKFELDKHRALLNHISDPFAKENMEDTIKDDEKHILRAEELNARYDKELAQLEKECRILLEGGKLSQLNSVEEDEIIDEINKDNNNNIDKNVIEKDENRNELNNNLNKEDEENKNDLAKFTERDEDNDIENPLKPEGDEIQPPKKDDPTEVEPPKKDSPVTKKELPKRIFTDEDEEDLDVEPPKEDEDDEDYEPVGEMEMDDTPVDAIVKEPKSGIWRRVARIVGRGVLYLSIVATAIHTGLSARFNRTKIEKNDSSEETIEETEKITHVDETPVETDTKEETKENGTEKKLSTTSTKKDKTEDKKEDTKTAEDQEFKIELKEGESVYNANTGVTVGYSGEANYEGKNGVVEQKNRDLNHTSNGNAIVTETDLNKDTGTKAPEVVTVSQTQRTGKEVSEEEFKKDKTAEERNNIDIAEEEAFMQFLQENGLGR